MEYLLIAFFIAVGVAIYYCFGELMLGTSIGFGLLVVIIYFRSMLTLNLLDNNQKTRDNSTKTVELLEEILNSINQKDSME